ncbi:L,D-transpeptidase [Paenibacillus thalictri]|uniref:L,D-transpeptidase n=2 Tax=Paenibacillus thalictri TaxID=2527873 RepID=A0A4Q9DWG2_9BACL|nr:L,D-transpeptidase [Paenibacillus thalictri]
MREKNHEEQLKDFFSQHPVDNPQYLKRYVKQHPNNKMAWYLLGREYAAQGKQGKALYCFTQAGEVYEAFEEQAAPVIPEMEADASASGAATRKRWGPLFWFRALVAAVAAVLLLLYIPPAPTPADSGNDAQIKTSPPPAQLKETKVYYIAKEKTKENVGAALQEILVKEQISSYSILVQGQPTPDGRYIDWLKPPTVLLSVEGKADTAQKNIQYHDALSCDCQPTEPLKPLSILTPWLAQQEQELVLHSSLQAFYSRYGKLPQAPGELNRPYPDNVLPGLTPYMEERFQQSAESMLAEIAGKPAEAAALPAGASGAPLLTKPLSEPLRIIVDKTAHRLALVSGNVIIRNYPVGLGGDKTPVGEYAISEKVRNPNGKSNGEFGSRGMTLSDTLYAIHGTNKPSSVGKDESHGCIRMLQQDVEELFDMAPMGTKVTIGSGLLPEGIERSGNPFQMPLFSEETNPNKVYKWLD